MKSKKIDYKNFDYEKHKDNLTKQDIFEILLNNFIATKKFLTDEHYSDLRLRLSTRDKIVLSGYYDLWDFTDRHIKTTYLYHYNRIEKYSLLLCFLYQNLLLKHKTDKAFERAKHPETKAILKDITEILNTDGYPDTKRISKGLYPYTAFCPYAIKYPATLLKAFYPHSLGFYYYLVKVNAGMFYLSKTTIDTLLKRMKADITLCPQHPYFAPPHSPLIIEVYFKVLYEMTEKLKAIDPALKLPEILSIKDIKALIKPYEQELKAVLRKLPIIQFKENPDTAKIFHFYNQFSMDLFNKEREAGNVEG